MDRLRWTDDRLDDAFKQIHARLRTVEDVNVRLTRVEGQAQGVQASEIRLAIAAARYPQRV